MGFWLLSTNPNLNYELIGGGVQAVAEVSLQGQLIYSFFVALVFLVIQVVNVRLHHICDTSQPVSRDQPRRPRPRPPPLDPAASLVIHRTYSASTHEEPSGTCIHTRRFFISPDQSTAITSQSLVLTYGALTCGCAQARMPFAFAPLLASTT